MQELSVLSGLIKFVNILCNGRSIGNKLIDHSKCKYYRLSCLIWIDKSFKSLSESDKWLIHSRWAANSFAANFQIIITDVQTLRTRGMMNQWTIQFVRKWNLLCWMNVNAAPPTFGDPKTHAFFRRGMLINSSIGTFCVCTLRLTGHRDRSHSYPCINVLRFYLRKTLSKWRWK
jgi:hypothetical protein